VKQLLQIETIPISIRYTGAQVPLQAECMKCVEREEKVHTLPKPKMDVYEKSEEEALAQNTYSASKEYDSRAFKLEILEMPKVVVKYVGGPMYIPKSADPEYEETEE